MYGLSLSVCVCFHVHVNVRGRLCKKCITLFLSPTLCNFFSLRVQTRVRLCVCLHVLPNLPVCLLLLVSSLCKRTRPRMWVCLHVFPNFPLACVCSVMCLHVQWLWFSRGKGRRVAVVEMSGSTPPSSKTSIHGVSSHCLLFSFSALSSPHFLVAGLGKNSCFSVVPILFWFIQLHPWAVVCLPASTASRTHRSLPRLTSHEGCCHDVGDCVGRYGVVGLGWGEEEWECWPGGCT